jgi:hypothetical protein
VSTFHPSFRDFLVDPHRCSDQHFLVKSMEDQHSLLYRCLQLMNRSLCYDICGIRRLGRANEDIQDLFERLTRTVPEAVRYACRFWPVHLVAGGFLAGVVAAALLELCTGHLAHWLEVLSLCRELVSAGKYLPRVIVWCQVSIFPASHQYLIDTHRVI